MSATETRALLQARLAELGERVDRIEMAQSEPVEADFAEQATAREDDEALDGIERSALQEIGQIKQALLRIDAGVYGRCASCGEPISLARLAAHPAAALCMDCAAPR